MRLHTFNFILFVTSLLLVGCTGENKESKKQSGTTPKTENSTGHTTMKMETEEPTEESIYNVRSRWKNRYDRELQLSELSGRIQVLAMVYTHCEHACPRILADMKRIRDELSEEVLQSTNFLIVSIDPERDTPERLRNFAEENNLNEKQWTLLNGGPGDVLELAALLGVKYKRISDTDFTHSNMITVLNREGEIVHQRKKLGDQPENIVRAVEKISP